MSRCRRGPGGAASLPPMFLIHAEVEDPAGRPAAHPVGEDEAVLARLQRLFGCHLVEPARVLFRLDVHLVLAADAELRGTAERSVRPARDLEVSVVVVAARLEPYERHVVRGPRAVEARLAGRDPVPGLLPPQDQLAL